MLKKCIEAEILEAFAILVPVPTKEIKSLFVGNKNRSEECFPRDIYFSRTFLLVFWSSTYVRWHSLPPWKAINNLSINLYYEKAALTPKEQEFSKELCFPRDNVRPHSQFWLEDSRFLLHRTTFDLSHLKSYYGGPRSTSLHQLQAAGWMVD